MLFRFLKQNMENWSDIRSEMKVEVRLCSLWEVDSLVRAKALTALNREERSLVYICVEMVMIAGLSWSPHSNGLEIKVFCLRSSNILLGLSKRALGWIRSCFLPFRSSKLQILFDIEQTLVVFLAQCMVLLQTRDFFYKISNFFFNCTLEGFIVTFFEHRTHDFRLFLLINFLVPLN
jgi:hypothetical protein